MPYATNERETTLGYAADPSRVKFQDTPLADLGYCIPPPVAVRFQDTPLADLGRVAVDAYSGSRTTPGFLLSMLNRQRQRMALPPLPAPPQAVTSAGAPAPSYAAVVAGRRPVPSVTPAFRSWLDEEYRRLNEELLRRRGGLSDNYMLYDDAGPAYMLYDLYMLPGLGEAIRDGNGDYWMVDTEPFPEYAGLGFSFKKLVKKVKRVGKKVGKAVVATIKNRYVVGAAAIIAGTALTVGTGGALAPAGLAVAGAGVGLAAKGGKPTSWGKPKEWGTRVLIGGAAGAAVGVGVSYVTGTGLFAPATSGLVVAPSSAGMAATPASAAGTGLVVAPAGAAEVAAAGVAAPVAASTGAGSALTWSGILNTAVNVAGKLFTRSGQPIKADPMPADASQVYPGQVVERDGRYYTGDGAGGLTEVGGGGGGEGLPGVTRGEPGEATSASPTQKYIGMAVALGLGALALYALTRKTGD